MSSPPASGKPLHDLSEGQRACLRGVLAMRSSKEIAKELGISPHTVDKRLKDAMKILGVSSRVEAARMLASEEREGYQPLVSPSPDLPPPPPAGAPGRHWQASGGNRLDTWQRLAIIMAIAIAAPMLLGAVASSLALVQRVYLGMK